MDEITACPGCGCEPEIYRYLVRSDTKKRIGYHCTCGAEVVNGFLAMWSPPKDGA